MFSFSAQMVGSFLKHLFNFSPLNLSHAHCFLLIGKHGNKIKLDEGTRMFLYQIVGTWGQLLFPRPWKEFRLWYDEHKAMGIKPLLDGMVFNIVIALLGDILFLRYSLFKFVRGLFVGDNRMVQEAG